MSIQLFVSDAAVLSSLEFSLAAEGLPACDGKGWSSKGAVAAVVIDRGDLGASLAFLAELRSEGCTAPAMVLATHPTARQRTQVAAAGAALIEKPLLGDELTVALLSALRFEKAA